MHTGPSMLVSHRCTQHPQNIQNSSYDSYTAMGHSVGSASRHQVILWHRDGPHRQLLLLLLHPYVKNHLGAIHHSHSSMN